MKLSKQVLQKIIEQVPKRVEPRPGFIQAAVLMLFFNRDEQTHLVYIKRTRGNTPHSGQIAFPGGKIEANDVTSQAAAFRETGEEIGVTPQLYEYAGDIGFYETSVSGYDACAHLAWCNTQPNYTPAPVEVSGVFEIPVASLCAQFIPDLNVSDTSPALNLKFNVRAGGDFLNIWGLTARITHHFLIGLFRNSK